MQFEWIRAERRGSSMMRCKRVLSVLYATKVARAGLVEGQACRGALPGLSQPSRAKPPRDLRCEHSGKALSRRNSFSCDADSVGESGLSGTCLLFEGERDFALTSSRTPVCYNVGLCMLPGQGCWWE